MQSKSNAKLFRVNKSGFLPLLGYGELLWAKRNSLEQKEGFPMLGLPLEKESTSSENKNFYNTRIVTKKRTKSAVAFSCMSLVWSDMCVTLKLHQMEFKTMRMYFILFNGKSFTFFGLCPYTIRMSIIMTIHVFTSGGISFANS
jgi:hypothetical protein